MLAVLALIITSVQSALLMRDPAYTQSIEVESVHQSQITTYRFRIQTDAQLSKGSIFTLTFPAEYLPVTTTACKILTYSSSGTGQTVIFTSCNPQIFEFNLQFPMPLTLKQGQTFGLQLQGVMNPTNYLSTGPFKMNVKVKEDSQYFAQNNSFDTLAFFPKLSESYSTMVINTSFASYKDTVGTLSDYAIEISHTNSLYKGTWYRLTLPTGWSKGSSSNNECNLVKSTSTAVLPEGDFYCTVSDNYVYLKGLTSNIEASSTSRANYVLMFKEILNPSSVKDVGDYNFYLDILEEGTSIVIERFKADSPLILPGSFSEVSVSSNIPSAKYVQGGKLLQTITAVNAHEIEAGGTLTFTLTSGVWYSAGGCYILPGISDYSTSQLAACSFSTDNKSINLTKLGKIPASTSIKLQASVTISSESDTLLVTSKNSSAKKIDEKSTSVFPRHATASIFTSYEASLSSESVSASSIIQVKFKPSIQAELESTMSIEYPSGLKVSSLTCSQQIDSGATITLSSCSVSENKIVLKLETIVPTTSYCTIRLIGFTNPEVQSSAADVYEICSDLYQGLNSYPYNSSCDPVSVVPETLLPANKIVSYIGISSANKYIPYLINLSPIKELNVETTRVEIQLPMKDNAGNNILWDIGLGVDTLECSFENLAVKSSCRVIAAPNTNSGSYVTIVLENLGILKTGTSQVIRTVFKAPKAISSFSYKMSYGYMENRIYRIVAYSSSLTFLTLSAQSACTAASITSRAFTEIDSSTDLVVSLQSSAAVSENDYLVMILPGGWDVSTISFISTDSVGIKNLVRIPNSYAPAVLGQVTYAAGIKNASASVVKISSLVNPRSSSYADPEVIHIGVASSAFASTCYGPTSNTLAISDSGTLTASIQADPDMQSFPGASYIFTIKTEHSIPDEGKIKFTLPLAFTDFSNLVVTTSALTYDSEDLQYSVSGQYVTLTYLASIQANTSLTVSLANLNNPSSSSVGTFEVKTYNTDDTIIDSVSGLSVSLPYSFSKGTITIKAITMDPNMAKANNADFYLTFRSSLKLPKNTIIEVTIPSQYFDLPSGSCNLNFYITSCMTTGHYITVNINQEIFPNTDIFLSLNGLLSVPAEDTDYFYIRTLYNGLVINESMRSKSNVNYFSPYVSSSRSSITVEEINFYPKNQGEPATYSFSLSISQELSSDHRIVIWFPDQFDPTLTTELGDINCWADPIAFVGSNLSCTLTGYRKVVITGHNTLQSNLPFTIYMSNIRNPSKGKINQFRGAIQDDSSNTILYMVKVGNLWMLSTPKPLLLRDISSELAYARILNTFSFQFGFSTTLLSDQNKGRIWIDFPTNFLLANPNTQRGWEYPCTAYLVSKFIQSTTPWSSSLKCINFNSNRIEVRGGVEIIADPNISLLLSISQVPGPQTDEITLPIKISTYDGITGILLDRTYELLSYPLTFQLDIKGEELIVNQNEQITVPRGTCSDTISINTVSEKSPMRVYLNIAGSISSISSTSFYPDDTLLFPISQSQLDFKVCIPYHAAKGSYVLEFNKDGDELTEGSVGEYIYAEIQSVILIVTEELSSIDVPKKIELPVPGHSFPIDIILERSPHSELFVTPRLTSNNGTGITFEPEYVLFEKGEDRKQIVIHSASEINQSRYSLTWEITGKDEESYRVPDNSEVNTIGVEFIVPVIEDIEYTPTRKSVEFSITISEPGVLYYQIELGDYPQPSPTTIVENYTAEKAYRLSVYDTKSDNILTVSNLAAETKYVMYATLQDRSVNLSNLYTLIFFTSKDYSSIKFVMDFEQFDPRNESSQSTLEEVIKPQLAKALSISSDRLSFHSLINDENTTRRQLESISSESINTSDYSEYALIVQVANDKYSDMISPEEIVNSTTIGIINKYLVQEGLAIKALSKSYSISNPLPSWYEDVNVWDASKDSITIVAKLKDEGYVHIVVLDVDSTPPTPQQIVWGLDGQGNIARHTYSYYDGISAELFVTYEGLSSDTKFDVYVSGTNNYPGNNKSVVEKSYSFSKVRTELDEVCIDCDKYMEVDETGALLSACAMFSYLALMA